MHIFNSKIGLGIYDKIFYNISVLFSVKYAVNRPMIEKLFCPFYSNITFDGTFIYWPFLTRPSGLEFFVWQKIKW